MISDSVITQNWLLAALPENERAALARHLQPLELRRRMVIFDSDEVNHPVIFPLSGIISFVGILDDGSAVEVGVFGRDGAVGAATALGTGQSNAEALVQVAGTGLLMPQDAFRRAVEEHPGFRRMGHLHLEVAIAQATQSLACSVHHLIDARLCRWLLLVRALLHSDELPLTQEFLALMLGVQRTSVTVAAGTLQDAGLISYHRGRIRILDVPGLERKSCECFERLKACYQRAFPEAREWDRIHLVQ